MSRHEVLILKASLSIRFAYLNVHTLLYLFAVALSFLARPDRVKCRYEVHRTIG